MKWGKEALAAGNEGSLALRHLPQPMVEILHIFEYKK